MKRSIKFLAGTAIATAIFAGGAVACSSGDGSVDVLQYGYYTPTHVFVAYPQPVIVHVTRKVYLSDTREYSTPGYEKTYVKTHTVTRQTTTTTTTRRSSGPTKTGPQDKVPLTKSPSRSTTSRTTTTTRTTTRGR